MKFKEFKIEVPEWDDANSDDDVFGTIKYPRKYIHKLVQPHAFRLGYNWTDKGVVSYINSTCLFFYEDGDMSYAHGVNHFKQHKHLQISWQDFLKLTKADVILNETKSVNQQYGLSETKIPYFPNIKVDGEDMQIGNPIASKVGQHIMIGNDSFKVGSIVNGAICLKRVSKQKHHRRIKLPMEV